MALIETLDISRVSEIFVPATQRLIVIDYDGVLVPYQTRPGLTIPPREVKTVVELLSNDPRTTVMLLSGRDQAHLQLHWGSHHAVLVAEYGASFRDIGKPWSSHFQLNDVWLEEVSRAMKALSFEYEETFIERKTHSIAWHYPLRDGNLSEQDIVNVITALRELSDNERFTIYRDHQTIELVPSGVNPGAFFSRWIESKTFDAVVAVCGQRTSSSLFATLPKDALTILVDADEKATARFRLGSQRDVLPLLQKLVIS